MSKNRPQTPEEKADALRALIREANETLRDLNEAIRLSREERNHLIDNDWGPRFEKSFNLELELMYRHIEKQVNTIRDDINNGYVEQMRGLMDATAEAFDKRIADTAATAIALILREVRLRVGGQDLRIDHIAVPRELFLHIPGNGNEQGG